MTTYRTRFGLLTELPLAISLPPASTLRPLRKFTSIGLVACALLALTTPALAQEGEGTPEDAGASEGAEESRFRWGITLGGGPMVGGYTGFGLGISGRVGMQIDPMFGVYAQPIALAAIGAQAGFDNAEVTAAGLVGVGVLADITLGDIFFIAAGPQVLTGGVGSSGVVSNADGTTTTIEASTGPFFGVATRAGVVLGSKKPTRRSGFSIGVNMPIVFAGEAVILPMVFIGYERF